MSTRPGTRHRRARRIRWPIRRNAAPVRSRSDLRSRFFTIARLGSGVTGKSPVSSAASAPPNLCCNHHSDPHFHHFTIRRTAPATRRIRPDTADSPRRDRACARAGRMKLSRRDECGAQRLPLRRSPSVGQSGHLPNTTALEPAWGSSPRARRIGRTSSRTPCGVARPDAPISASGCVRRPKGDAREMPRHQPAVGLGAARSE